MSVKDYIDRRKAEGNMAHVMVTSKIHPDASPNDIQQFRDWLKMAIKDGVNGIKIQQHPTDPDIKIVVIKKKEVK